MMPDTCRASATPEASNHSCDRECVVDHTRRVCWEALAELAGTTLSRSGDSKEQPEFWVGQLEYLLGHLLITLETEP